MYVHRWFVHLFISKPLKSTSKRFAQTPFILSKNHPGLPNGSVESRFVCFCKTARVLMYHVPSLVLEILKDVVRREKIEQIAQL